MQKKLIRLLKEYKFEIETEHAALNAHPSFENINQRFFLSQRIGWINDILEGKENPRGFLDTYAEELETQYKELNNKPASEMINKGMFVRNRHSQVILFLEQII